MHLVRWAALAACSFAVSSSIAAPFPASSGNAATARVARADSIDGYQQYAQKEECQSKGVCVLNFPEVGGSEVVVQHVSCTFGVKTGVKVEYAYLDNAFGVKDGFNMTAAEKVASFSGADFYTINAQTYLFVPEGQRPQITVVSENKNAEHLECTVSGQHALNPE